MYNQVAVHTVAPGGTAKTRVVAICNSVLVHYILRCTRQFWLNEIKYTAYISSAGIVTTPDLHHCMVALFTPKGQPGWFEQAITDVHPSLRLQYGFSQIVTGLSWIRIEALAYEVSSSDLECAHWHCVLIDHDVLVHVAIVENMVARTTGNSPCDRISGPIAPL